MKSFLLALSVLPTIAAAQQPTLSPRLERVLARDTVLAVWLFVHPDRSLAEAAAVVSAAGGQVRHQSRWLHAVSANVSSATLRALRIRPELRHLQPVAAFTGRPDGPIARAPMGAGGADPAGYGPSAMPFRRLNLAPLADRGFRGTGIRIAILDTGFETGMRPFSGARVIAQRDFIRGDNVVGNQAGDPTTQSNHGTQTWSLIGANVPDTLVGIAPDAGFILAKTEDVSSERRVEEDNYVAALEWADSLDADVVSASLGYFDFDNGFAYLPSQLDGDFAVTTRAADEAARRGIIVVVSAGNDGPAPRSISTPADGDSVISVGATDSLGALAGFSSRGPTADGRTKPDLTAPGVAVWVFGPGGYGRSNGTSFAAPIIAGAAALLKQIHPTLGPIEVRDALRGAASHRGAPDSNRGWGTPNATLAAVFPQGLLPVSPSRPVLAEDPLFSWSAPVVAAFAAPLLRYDLRVTRAQGGDVVYSAGNLTTMSHVPAQRLRTNVALRWEVRAMLGSDSVTTIEGASFTIVEDAPPLTLLFQNFPNPFPDRSTGQRTTCVWFDLAAPGVVRLDVLDLRGHVIRNLVPGSQFGEQLPAGRYGRPSPNAITGCDPALEWDGTDQSGNVMPRGIYLVKLVTPDGVSFRRVVFLGPGV